MSETLNTKKGVMKTFMNYEICDEAARISIAELEENKADVLHTHSADEIVDGIIPIENGGTGADNHVNALHNLGIYWGEDDAEDYWTGLYPDEEERKTARSNTIYIQIN